MELEAGVKLLAEDLNCPGILPGAGHGAADLRLDYYFEITITYQPRQEAFVPSAVRSPRVACQRWETKPPAMNGWSIRWPTSGRTAKAPPPFALRSPP